MFRFLIHVLCSLGVFQFSFWSILYFCRSLKRSSRPLLLQALLRSIRWDDGCISAAQRSYKLRTVLLNVATVQNHLRADDEKSMQAGPKIWLTYWAADYLCLILFKCSLYFAGEIIIKTNENTGAASLFWSVQLVLRSRSATYWSFELDLKYSTSKLQITKNSLFKTPRYSYEKLSRILILYETFLWNNEVTNFAVVSSSKKKSSILELVQSLWRLPNIYLLVG